MKLVSIIIPHYNGKELLYNCINSIYQNIEIEDFEIIVVDNGSTDDSVQNIKQLFSKVVIIHNQNQNEVNLFVRRSFSEHLFSWMNDSASRL